jgi:hypothetical protein
MSSSKASAGEFFSGLLIAALAGLGFYVVTVVLLGWGESRTGAESGTYPNVGLLATTILTWVAVVKKLRGKWNWSILQGIVFLAVGAFVIWGACGITDRDGHFDMFKPSFEGFVIAASFLGPCVIVGAFGGFLQYGLRPKKRARA